MLSDAAWKWVFYMILSCLLFLNFSIFAKIGVLPYNRLDGVDCTFAATHFAPTHFASMHFAPTHNYLFFLRLRTLQLRSDPVFRCHSFFTSSFSGYMKAQSKLKLINARMFGGHLSFFFFFLLFYFPKCWRFPK